MNSKKTFIDEAKILNILEQTKDPSPEKLAEIMAKAEKMRGLDLEEVGYLVNAGEAALEQMFATAGKIKREIYGERLVLFAPLYASSYCVNDCEYCAFHCRNTAPRKKLTLEEVEEEVKSLVDMGHKRLLLEFGEHPAMAPIDYVVDVIKTIYKTKSDKGEIRRVNVNIAATTVEDYRKLKECGIGTYQLFQETYHRETYDKLHRGPKSDYERQLFAHDRAFEAGIDDVGIGVLFGLYDWKFEVLALVAHAQYLEDKLGVGPHTISVPRFQPAETVNLETGYSVSEDELLKIIAILRMAVPYTGMIISSRERAEIRAKAFEIGISQTSAGSKTSPGGYSQKEKEKETTQFHIQDHRSIEEMVESVLRQGLMPSFCTACYRQGRTGASFMDLAKPGEIHNFCRPNAILTFKEYLIDYATPEVKALGEQVIEKYMQEIPDKNIARLTDIRLKRIEEGERDIYF